MATKKQGSKQERAYGVLRSRIVDGTYGPGHRLVIDALARELRVSPMPVREAIRRLEAEGWIMYVPNQGAQVAPVDVASWTDAMTALAVLEGYATALSAPLLGARDIAVLRSINEAMRAAIEGLDMLNVSKRNQAFHGAIYARCPNRYLRQSMETIQERLSTLVRSTVFMYVPMRGLISVDEHEHLLVLVERGADAAVIEAHARDHKMHTVAAYADRLAEAV